MSEYPEHDKLTKVSEKTQAIGDFLEWIGAERSARLMVWCEWDEQEAVECTRHGRHPNRIEQCDRCDDGGMYQVTRHYARWTPLDGSVQDWLADWAGLDLDKIEAEKRAMLDMIREANRARDNREQAASGRGAVGA